MISIKMTPDIRQYEPKTFVIFTTRQALSLGAAAAASFIMFTGLGFVPIAIRCFLMFVIFFFGIMFGWFKIYNMPFEELLLHILGNRMSVPKKRYYASVSAYGRPDEGPPGEGAEKAKKKKPTREERKAREALYQKYGAAR